MTRPAHNETAKLRSSRQLSIATVGSALPRVLVLTGPTAVGKTQLSVSLAQQLDGEIISADSMQVYKGLDIGSDKASLLGHPRWQL